MSQPETGFTTPRRLRSFPLRAATGGLGALAVLSIGHMVIDAYSSAYAPILAILREQLGLTFAQVGWGAAVFSFSASILQPLYGIASDRTRSAVILVLAPGIAALGLGTVSLVDGYAAMLALLFVGGVGVAAYHPQGASQAADALPHRPSLSMALFVGAGNVGFAAGPALLTWTYATWGWDGLWRVGVPGLLTTLLLFSLVPERRIEASAHERGRAIDALAACWRPLLLMYLFVVVRGIVQLLFVGFLPLYMIDAGMTVGGAGFGLSCFLAAGSAGSITGGVLADRVGERRMLRLSMLGALPLYGVAFLLPSVPLQVAMLSVGFFTLLLSNPITVVLAQSWVPHHRSTVSSLLMGFAWGVGGLVAPLFGRIADAVGLGPSLAVVGLLPIIGAALAWRLPPRG